MSTWAKPGVVNPGSDLATSIKRVNSKQRNAQFTTDFDPQDKPRAVENVTVEYRMKEMGVELTFFAIVHWDPVPPGTCLADIAQYEVQIQPSTADGTPIHRRNLHQRLIPVTDGIYEDAADNELSTKFSDIEHGRTWYWQARVRAIARNKRRTKGVFSPWTTPRRPIFAAGPKAPPVRGVRMDFERHVRNRHSIYDAVITWDELSWDIPPNDPNPGQHPQPPTQHEDDVKAYHIQFQHCTQTGASIGKPREHTKLAKDNDTDTTSQTVFHTVNKFKWFKARVRAQDRFNRNGEWSPYTNVGSISDNTPPPKPLRVGLDVREHNIELDWDSPKEAFDIDQDIITDEIAYFQVQFSDDANFNQTGYFRFDRYVHAERRQFAIKKPNAGITYFGRVRSVDGSDNKSAWVVASAQGVYPPAPSNPPSVIFDANEAIKWHPLRALVDFTYNKDNYAEKHIEKFEVQLQGSPDSSFSDNDNFMPRTRRFGADIHQRGASVHDHRYIFGRVKRKRWFRARYRAIDTEGRKSGFSPWSNPKRAKGSPPPPIPQNIGTIRGINRVGIQWDTPSETADAEFPADNNFPDEQVTHFQAQLLGEFGEIKRDEKYVIHEHIRWKVDDANYRMRVRSWDAAGEHSDWKWHNGTIVSGDTTPAGVGTISAKDPDDVITGAKIQTDNVGSRIVLKDNPGEPGVIKIFGTNNQRGQIRAEFGNLQIDPMNGAWVTIDGNLKTTGFLVGTNTPDPIPDGFAIIYKVGNALRAKGPGRPDVLIANL